LCRGCHPSPVKRQQRAGARLVPEPPMPCIGRNTNAPPRRQRQGVSRRATGNKGGVQGTVTDQPKDRDPHLLNSAPLFFSVFLPIWPNNGRAIPQINMKRLTAGILLGLWFSGLCSAQKKCYYPNGLEAANDHPCDPSDTNSACCGGGLGAVCLTNKLCRSPDGNTIRGSCTDKSWASADCPQYCLGASEYLESM
jgi:hypothetical protein